MEEPGELQSMGSQRVGHGWVTSRRHFSYVRKRGAMSLQASPSHMYQFLLVVRFRGNPVGKKSACSAGDSGSIPGLGRSPREGNGSPLQYSCLENPMDREAWRATVHGVTRVRHDLATKPPPPHFSYGRNRSAMSLQASPSHTYQFLLVVKFTFLRSGFYYPFNYQACI